MAVCRTMTLVLAAGNLNRNTVDSTRTTTYHLVPGWQTGITRLRSEEVETSVRLNLSSILNFPLRVKDRQLQFRRGKLQVGLQLEGHLESRPHFHIISIPHRHLLHQ